MPEGQPGVPPPVAPVSVVRPRTALAWVAIVLLVGVILALHATMKADPESSGDFGNAVTRTQVLLQYGIRELAERFTGDARAFDVDSSFGQIEAAAGGGPVPRRQRFAVVAGDMRGREEALRVLDDTERLLKEKGLELSPKEREVQDALRTLYGTPNGITQLDAGRRDLLRRELDWFGELALAPPGSADRQAVMEPARRATRNILLLGAAILMAGATGVVGLAVHLFLAKGRRLRWRLEPGRAPGGIYAETFAVWFVLFLVLSLGVSLLGTLLPAGSSPMLLASAGMLGSLAALGWPVLRGVPWETVRDDLGLRLSPTPFQDVLAGFYCWVSAIPVMFLAALATCGLAALESAFRAPPGPFDPVAPPHPLGPELVHGYTWIYAFFAASFVAPIVEETFFRGALYRHLRDASGRARRLEGALVSGLLSSFLFAVIHPQGLSAVPVLMAVALPLWWSREWRGSLLAPMAAHSLHNAIVTLVGVAQFRS
jgi:membrane protease YdiL (CAAX protease family)